MDLYITIAALVIILIFLLVVLFSKTGLRGYESEKRRAGRVGERITHGILREILRDDDVLLSNVKLNYKDKRTELDNLIINDHGVFIIEVKNWSGDLIGDEDDREWTKIKYSPAGAPYQGTVKNPIKQVKRQIYILANSLRRCGINVNIEGYVFFLENNCPFMNEHVLRNQRDMDKVIHYGTDNKLTRVMQDRIVEALG